MDQTNTYYAGRDIILKPQALFLPTLRGFGTLKDLHVAVSTDEMLLELLQNLTLKTDLNVFASPEVFDRNVEQILFQWANVAIIDPASRGPNIDARKLEFLEHFFGNKFVHQSGSSNPPPGAAQKLLEAWDKSFENMRAHLLLQICGNELFPDTSYDPFKGDVSGSLALSQTGIENLAVSARQAGSGQVIYWQEVARFLKYTKKLENISPQETAWLSEAVDASGSPLRWANIAGQLSK